MIEGLPDYFTIPVLILWWLAGLALLHWIYQPFHHPRPRRPRR